MIASVMSFSLRFFEGKLDIDGCLERSLERSDDESTSTLMTFGE